MLVLGRANPLQRGNIMFARRLMAVGEGLHPDLFQGFFMGRGHYNQDLDPGMVLVEAGIHTMAQPVAERRIGLFAQVVAGPVGLPGAHGEEELAHRLPAGADACRHWTASGSAVNDTGPVQAVGSGDMVLSRKVRYLARRPAPHGCLSRQCAAGPPVVELPEVTDLPKRWPGDGKTASHPRPSGSREAGPHASGFAAFRRRLREPARVSASGPYSTQAARPVVPGATGTRRSTRGNEPGRANHQPR